MPSGEVLRQERRAVTPLASLLLGARAVETWEWWTVWRLFWPQLIGQVENVGRVGTVTARTS